jgi:hypothetical protein
MKSKKMLIGIAAVAMLALMIANVYADGCCGCAPGLTPGFWKNNLAVYLGLANGNRGYSDPTGSPTVTKDNMGAFFDSLAGTHDLNQLYRNLCPQLDGTTADIRNNAANIFNLAAGLAAGPPWN